MHKHQQELAHLRALHAKGLLDRAGVVRMHTLAAFTSNTLL